MAPGQTYWYWLETVDVNGVTELHGPVSAMLQSPTIVVLGDFGAGATPDGETRLGRLVAVGFAMLGALAAMRWRFHRQPGA